MQIVEKIFVHHLETNNNSDEILVSDKLFPLICVFLHKILGSFSLIKKTEKNTNTDIHLGFASRSETFRMIIIFLVVSIDVAFTSAPYS